MSAEPLPVPLPGTGRGPQQAELDILSPFGGIEHDFRAVLEGNADTFDALIVLIEEGRPRRVVPIRIQPTRDTIRQDGELRNNIYHIGNAQWWIIDANGHAVCHMRRCNGFINLQVTEHEAPLGKIRTRL